MSMKIMIQILKINFFSEFLGRLQPCNHYKYAFLVKGTPRIQLRGILSVIYAAVSKQYHYVSTVYKKAKNGIFALNK
jgi:hypothetical protein